MKVVSQELQVQAVFVGVWFFSDEFLGFIQSVPWITGISPRRLTITITIKALRWRNDEWHSLKPHHRAYDQVTTYLRPKNVGIVGKSQKERTTGRG